MKIIIKTQKNLEKAIGIWKTLKKINKLMRYPVILSFGLHATFIFLLNSRAMTVPTSVIIYGWIVLFFLYLILDWVVKNSIEESPLEK